MGAGLNGKNAAPYSHFLMPLPLNYSVFLFYDRNQINTSTQFVIKNIMYFE